MHLCNTNFSSVTKGLQRRHCLNKNSPSLIYEVDKENQLQLQLYLNLER